MKRNERSGKDVSARNEAQKGIKTIVLTGNPNVGKSTIFNALTGLKQHTGNWTGKTVGSAEGRFDYGGEEYCVIDLPGTYSLEPHSAEEKCAGDFILNNRVEKIVAVCDAGCLSRSLILVMQIIKRVGRANLVVCVNLIDEAKKKGIHIDGVALSEKLGVPVVLSAARQRDGLEELKRAITAAAEKIKNSKNEDDGDLVLGSSFGSVDEDVLNAEEAAASAIRTEGVKGRFSGRLDRILTGRFTGFPVMLIMLSLILWLTIKGANYPSELLWRCFYFIECRLTDLFLHIGVPFWLTGVLIKGAYRTLAWVVSVMLPPMAIFFPLFTLLEDFGYLPRVAFNLDRCFYSCRTCGKQSLTMCMGLGCNAAGVVGCRIIDSDRERKIAILTNSFMPCNGRFPTLIALILIFFSGTGSLAGFSAALMLTGVIVAGVFMTFLCSRLLSSTIFRGEPSAFTLELPPYRRPEIFKVIIRSMRDRTLYVLGRAAAVAAPAGVFIWLLANINIFGEPLLSYCTGFFEPLGRFLGMDGVILIAFLLALPANEIAIPIMLLSYTSAGELNNYASLRELQLLLSSNGWTSITAFCVIVFMLFHSPCSTTLWTIKKETGSWGMAALGAIIPTVLGIIICMLVSALTRLCGIY